MDTATPESTPSTTPESVEAVDPSEHASGHTIGFVPLAATSFALAMLTGASFITMRLFGDTPTIAWSIMLAVSTLKAMLVAMVFMHLWWEGAWKYVVTVPTVLMACLLIAMLVPDIGLRTESYSEERWLHSAEGEDHEPPSATPNEPRGES